jgi:hypothetical protein
MAESLKSSVRRTCAERAVGRRARRASLFIGGKVDCARQRTSGIGSIE